MKYGISYYYIMFYLKYSKKKTSSFIAKLWLPCNNSNWYHETWVELWNHHFQTVLWSFPITSMLALLKEQSQSRILKKLLHKHSIKTYHVYKKSRCCPQVVCSQKPTCYKWQVETLHICCEKKKSEVMDKNIYGFPPPTPITFLWYIT